jgi:TRAP-type uncharacterized transport system substrate-binding protein
LRGLKTFGTCGREAMGQQEKTGRKRVAKEPFREHLMMVVTTVLVGIVVLAVVNHFIEPAPPRTIVMSTGMEGGSYAAYSEWYRQILGREKIRLELLPSSGSVENLKRLRDPSFKVDVGFVQGGTGSRTEAPNLLSLGALFYTPLWVFYRSPETYDDLSRLKGKKINIGPEGSGVRKFAVDLLEASQAAEPPTSLLDLPNTAAAKELVEGRIDAVMIFGTADSPTVQELLRKNGVKLLSFSQAEAYTRLFPALSHVVLPTGLLDLAKKKPPSDVHLLAITTNLVARDTLHPALVYLLLDAVAEVHSGGGWVHKAGEFPSPKAQDFPLSDRAERFYKSGRPLLFDYLPFWVATFVDRLILLLVPTAVVLIPLIRIMPWFYSWRNRRKFFYWYGELKNLELEVRESPQPERAGEYRARLDRIETAVNEVQVPLGFFHEAYNLKQHIELVRGKLTRLNELPAAEPPPAAGADQRRE